MRCKLCWSIVDLASIIEIAMYITAVFQFCLGFLLLFFSVEGQDAPYDPSPFTITGKIDRYVAIPNRNW